VLNGLGSERVGRMMSVTNSRGIARPLLTALIAVSFLFLPLAALASQQRCTYSYWVWMGGERVKVCCNQQNFCTTKYGVYKE
jgi:hypothetical protein